MKDYTTYIYSSIIKNANVFTSLVRNSIRDLRVWKVSISINIQFEDADGESLLEVLH